MPQRVKGRLLRPFFATGLLPLSPPLHSCQRTFVQNALVIRCYITSRFYFLTRLSLSIFFILELYRIVTECFHLLYLVPFFLQHRVECRVNNLNPFLPYNRGRVTKYTRSLLAPFFLFYAVIQYLFLRILFYFLG